MGYIYNASCGSFLGNARNNNEDNFFFNKKHLPVINKGLKNPIKCKGTTDEPMVFAVFDGMGGEEKGEEAAFAASEVFSKEAKKLEEIAFSGKEFMLRTCGKANDEINKKRIEKQIGVMGTTVAALYFSQDEVFSCNMGDSRVYRIRDKQMVQISQDHTDEKIMSAIGIHKKPVLLQYLGIPETQMSIEPYISKGDIKSGDIYILCTDGVTDSVNISLVYEIVCNNDPDTAVREILAQVDKQNGCDNATVIVVNFV